MDRWSQVEPIARDKAYKTLERDPQVLLEDDSWFNVDADLFHARLLGVDGQIDRDGWWLKGVDPVLFLPVIRPMRSWLREGDDTGLSLPQPARYVLQSGYARMPLAAEYAPPNVKLRPDFTFVVAYLRYRRRL